MTRIAIGLICVFGVAGRAYADDNASQARTESTRIANLLAEAQRHLDAEGMRATSSDRIALGLLRGKFDTIAAEFASLGSALDAMDDRLGWLDTEIETLEARHKHIQKINTGRLEPLAKQIDRLKELIKQAEADEPKSGSQAAWNAWRERVRRLDARHNQLVDRHNAILLQEKKDLDRIDAKATKLVSEFNKLVKKHEQSMAAYNRLATTFDGYVADAAPRLARVRAAIEAARQAPTVDPGAMVTEAQYRKAVARVKEIDARVAMHEKVLASIRLHARSLGKERNDFAVMRAAATEVSLASAIDALGIGRRLRAMRRVTGAKDLLAPTRVRAIEAAFAAAVTGLHAGRAAGDAKAREAALDAGRKALGQLAFDLRKAKNRQFFRQIEAAAKLLDLTAKAGVLMLDAAAQSRRASWSGLARELAAFVADTAPALHPVIGAADASIHVVERALQWKVAEDGLKQLSVAMDSQDYAAMVHSRKLADLHQDKALHQRTIKLYEMSNRER